MNVQVVSDERWLSPVGTGVNTTVSTDAVALVEEAQIPVKCTHAKITNGAGGAVMLRFDAGNPTDATGEYMAAGGSRWVHRDHIAAVRAIRQGAADSIVHTNFWA